MSEEKVELVLVPSVEVSHIIPTVEFVKKLLLNHGHRFNITFLVIPSPKTNSVPQDYIDSVTNSDPRIRFISLPPAEPPPPGTVFGVPYFLTYINNYQQHVKQALTQLTSNSVRLIVDMFTVCMMDVAKELGFPSYLFFTSGAASLGFLMLLPALDSKITTEFQDYSTEFNIPSYINPLPTSSLPSMYFNRINGVDYKWFFPTVCKYKEAKGIIVNSLAELELQAVHAFDGLISDIPRVYLVGPLLDLERKSRTISGSDQAQEEDRIMKWLDDQPEESVLFICFGSRASMSVEQVKEIANGLERSGERFLWSITKTSPGHTNPEEVLPDGFMERVGLGRRGLVCGWAPQVEILGHKATKGFVTHCGWNSVLESCWFGVPMLTWPLDAEQRQNAFQLVKDLGLAMEIREGYHKREGNELVVTEEVERGVKGFVERESDMRKKMKEMSDKCREAFMEGESSMSTLKRLVEDLTRQV